MPSVDLTSTGHAGLTGAGAARSGRLRPVRLWLYAVAALIVLMVVVGGATRLTESGLSITEWKPVTGMLPPLGEAAWQAEFEKYQQIPQYTQLNRGMSLSEFKYIFWWEWAHRLLGRLIGFVFLLPFLVFLWRGLIDRALGWKLGGLFLLGGMQGAIGWWMVASGLVNRTSVSQYRLAIHLTFACLILAATIAVATSLRAPPDGEPAAPRRARLVAGGLIGVVLLQIFLGGLVAGLDAGLTYTTWPLMDGHLVPPLENLLVMDPAWRNAFENVLTVQFDHRMTAYALWMLTLLHALDLWGVPGAGKRALHLFALVSVQALLGILTLINHVPIDIALAHQFCATLVLIAVTAHAVRLRQAWRVAGCGLAGRMAGD
ncbi:COX15/CtaA family protein [Ancylobacter sp. 6x-1]|uniref:Heme A synthase n=1 Tax=Ancylobacter crimeensis TaxID=2579147 RepID=A0ABT0DD14_9HYPH|nr:COX15/CtaA family protein [Ancylobacter crimeensis]MCK0197764.1 COX15/CtaA family protein [Ancylobacter crimeensis]